MSDAPSLCWKYLCPATGVNEFTVFRVGEPLQIVEINGVVVDAPPGTTMFTGPGGNLLELRKISEKWRLIVDGALVEEYEVGKHSRGDENSLRELRHMPEGSYMIAPALTVQSDNLKIVRKFRFIVNDSLQELHVAHKDWIWHFIHNGCILNRLTHSMAEDNCERHFELDNPDGTKAMADVRMDWDERQKIWKYSLKVNTVPVPTFWTSSWGQNDEVMPPEVSNFGVNLEDVPSPPDSLPCQMEHRELESLPQGVSYDAAHKAYQANMMVRGKFMFLGEFATVEEARDRYQSEVAKVKERANGCR